VPGTADASVEESAPRSEAASPSPASRAESWFSRPVSGLVDESEEYDQEASVQNEPAPTRRRVARDDDDGAIPIRSGRVEVEEMDLTPMVDMTFLLLIFFMITASFSLHKTIQVPVPDANAQGEIQAEPQEDDLLSRSVRVEIDSDSVIHVDDEVVADRSRLADTIREKSLIDQRNELILFPNPKARHEIVVAVVDAAFAAGMQSIRVSSAGSIPD
jgi:biopolymer transport protein ExbD